MLPNKLRRVLESARRSNSTMYVVDPREVSGRHSDTDRGVVVEATEQVMAKWTGGYAAIGTEDSAAGLARILSELDNYCVLGFPARDPKSDRPQSLNIRVKREGLIVRHRAQYQLDLKTRATAARASAKDPLLGLAYLPMPVRDLPLRLWTTVIPATPAAPVALWLDSGRDTVGEYGMWVIDMATNKEAIKPIGRVMSGIVPSLLPLAGPALRPGRYQIRVAARTETHDRGGSVFTTITVPASSVFNGGCRCTTWPPVCTPCGSPRPAVVNQPRTTSELF